MTAKILSIDGGGIRGVATLQQLITLEKTLRAPLHVHFDYITGTSTGSIVAGLLSIGMSPKDILQLYQEHGEKIFEKRFWRFGLTKSKYKDEALNEALQDYTQGKLLRDCLTKLIIPAYNVSKRQIKIFKSYKDGNLYSLFDVVRASSAAPTFFDPWKINGETFVDGGLVANNPSMIAVIEAMKDGYDTFNIISFSTGPREKALSDKETKNGIVGMASPTVDILLTEQSQMTDYTLGKLFELNSIKGTYVRCETYLARASSEMDDASLCNLTNLIYDGEDSAVINKNKMINYYNATMKRG
jgi:patatin-like phospholipase/acyl hydrolase